MAIELFKPSDQSTSEQVDFYYTPGDKYFIALVFLRNKILLDAVSALTAKTEKNDKKKENKLSLRKKERSVKETKTGLKKEILTPEIMPNIPAEVLVPQLEPFQFQPGPACLAPAPSQDLTAGWDWPHIVENLSGKVESLSMELAAVRESFKRGCDTAELVSASSAVPRGIPRIQVSQADTAMEQLSLRSSEAAAFLSKHLFFSDSSALLTSFNHSLIHSFY